MSKSTPALVLDRFHSHLLDRLALHEGLVARDRWHGLPSTDSEGDFELFRCRIVEENFGSPAWIRGGTKPSAH
ncbi:MAG: hypothetical protein QOJ91_3070 [Sphingomonadales bacterium]|jgi:hypothetical protein|nr:hypothetical protein [Sphingomonadales bacterium]